MSESDLEQLRLDGLPATLLSPGQLKERPLTALLAECGMAKSGKQVKDALGRGAISINGRALASEDNMRLDQLFDAGNALFGRYYIVRMGKKNYHLLLR